MRFNEKTMARSALVALFMTIAVMISQASKNRFILHAGPPTLAHLVAIAVYYLATGFAFAIGFFLVADRLPGRRWIGKGLRYGIMLLLVIWFSGLVAMLGIDFEGGWNMRSPAKIGYYCLNLLIGGTVLGLIASRDSPAVQREVPPSANLAARIAAEALLLPHLCVCFFYLTTLALPSGFDLSGESGKVFHFFVFVPLAISGGGTALFHEVLRSARQRSIAVESSRIFRVIYVLYWVTNNAFIPFLGFTWQTLADFLVAGAAALLSSGAVSHETSPWPLARGMRTWGAKIGLRL